MTNLNNQISDHILCFKNLQKMSAQVEEIGMILKDTIKNNKKILICGNGGSASDSQHFAAEIVGRYLKERKGWPSIALTTDTSILTAVGNDYGFNSVFERQVEALGNPGDALIGISTSGNSENVIRAIHLAKEMNIATIGLLGRDGGKMKSICDQTLIAPSEITARIQEMHIFILHSWAEIIEQ